MCSYLLSKSYFLTRLCYFVTTVVFFKNCRKVAQTHGRFGLVSRKAISDVLSIAVDETLMSTRHRLTFATAEFKLRVLCVGLCNTYFWPTFTSRLRGPPAKLLRCLFSEVTVKV